MKTLLLTLSAACLLCGCSTTSGTRVSPDGQSLTIKNNRFFWASEGIDASVQDEHGFKFALKVSKSNVDAAAITAVGDAVIKGVAAGKP